MATALTMMNEDHVGPIDVPTKREIPTTTTSSSSNHDFTVNNISNIMPTRMRNGRSTSTTSAVSTPTLAVTFDWRRFQLCGREEETEWLQETYHDRDKVDLVVIGGRQGSGKTALSETIKADIKNDGGFIVRGRWPPESDPHEAFGEAFSDLVQQIKSSKRSTLQDFSSAVLKDQSGDGLDNENSMWLPDRLNVLRTLIEGGTGGQEVAPHGGTGKGTINMNNDNHGRYYQQPLRLDRKDLFHSTVYRILKAVGSVLPVVIVLDNLQSADRPSTDLLSFLCKSPSLRNVLFVTTCRGEEVDCDRFLYSTMQIDQSKVCIKEINLKPLPLNATQQLVSQLTFDSNLSEDDCFRLAENLHACTRGSPRMMCEVLSMMEKKRVDVRTLQEPLNYDDLVIDRIQKMPSACRQVLQVLSCLGGRNVHVSVLEDVLHPVSQRELLDVLYAAKDDGLLTVNESSESNFIRYPRLKGRVQEVVYEIGRAHV